MTDPLTLAVNLEKIYGHRLDEPIIYTQGVAVSARVKLQNLVQVSPDTLSGIIEVVAPFVSDPTKIFTPKSGTANYAGIGWTEEMAEATGKDKYANLLVMTADKFTENTKDNPISYPLDPDVRVEDMFFASLVLGKAFKRTGNERYAEVLKNFLIACDTQQDIGLWWHCHESPFFWGRGNAFAALGFAEALTYLPDNLPGRDQLLAKHLHHLEALKKFQDETGMWRQVINNSDSYLEHSATTMIGSTIARGIRLGWLDNHWIRMLDKIWEGVISRTDLKGNLNQVCTGTGPQSDVESYMKRPFSNGRDDRGGAMTLLFVTELLLLSNNKTAKTSSL